VRNITSAAILLASIGALLGVGERAFAALRMNWKFGFEKVEPIYLVPQSFGLFTVCFVALVVGALFAGRLWKQSERPAPQHVRWLVCAQVVQLAAVGLLLLMFGGGFFSVF
jgi:hypothetical protein